MKYREGLSTAVVVLLVTLFVWVVADRSVLRASPEITVAIEVGSPDPLYRLRVVDPAGPDGMLVRFRGPGRAIDTIASHQSDAPLRFRHVVRQEQLAGNRGEIILPVRVGFSHLDNVSLEYARTPGDQQPIENLIVQYEREEKLTEIPVELSAEDRRLLGENVLIEPQRVSAVILASQRDELRTPLVAIPQLDLREVQPGREVTRTVTLRSNQSENLDVTFNPPRVTVRFQLVSRNIDREMQGIGVVVEAPPDLLNHYSIELTDSRVSVLKVTGPADEVDALTPQDVTAALVLTERDRPGPSVLPRPLVIRFPPGSNVKLNQQPPMATFILRDRVVPPAE
jgi:hypothetical protein